MDLQLCVICLHNYKLQVLDDIEIQIYNLLVGTEFPDRRRLCYICRHHIKKIAKFRKYCLDSQSKLQQALCDNSKDNCASSQFSYCLTKQIVLKLRLCTSAACYDSDNSEGVIAYSYSEKSVNDYTDEINSTSGPQSNLDGLNMEDIGVDEERTQTNFNDSEVISERRHNSKKIFHRRYDTISSSSDTNLNAYTKYCLSSKNRYCDLMFIDNEKDENIDNSEANCKKSNKFKNLNKECVTATKNYNFDNLDITEETFESLVNDRTDGEQIAKDDVMKQETLYIENTDNEENSEAYIIQQKTFDISNTDDEQDADNNILKGETLCIHKQENEQEIEQNINKEYFDERETADNIIEEKTLVINNAVNELDTEGNIEKDAPDINETNDEPKMKDKSSKELTFEKIKLTMEEQKAELDAMRKEKKYTNAKYKCYNCAMGFKFKDSLQNHMVRHEESNGKYCCDVCGLRFAISNVLSMHRAMHAERHRCSRCGAIVKRDARNRHSTRCVGSEPSMCHECGKKFEDSKRMQQHMTRTHSDKSMKKAFICNICNKRYKMASSLRVHMIRHTNERFYCDRCPSTFSNPYTMSKHIALHNGTYVRKKRPPNTGSYECSVCDRVCPSRRLLELHTQQHFEPNHACPTCSATYHTRPSLLRHMKTHAGVSITRSVICHVCGKSFKDQSKLNRHIKQVCKPKQTMEYTGEQT